MLKKLLSSKDFLKFKTFENDFKFKEKAFVFFSQCWKQIALVVGFIMLLYYPLGMAVIHEINDDTDYNAIEVPENGSNAVALTADLILREVKDTSWTANAPFFFPASALDNMPNFQMGIVKALYRFAIELSDQLGRTRGSSQVDKDLDKAAGLLKYPGTVWIIDPSVSFMPTASSTKQYMAARKALLAYNKRLSEGSAVFEKRADNLMETLNRISKDLGSSSAIIDKQIEKGSGQFFDFNSDDVFYSTKGHLYAYYLVLRELGKDFEAILKDKELSNVWSEMLHSMKLAAKLQPMVIINSTPDSQILPSHLAAQGFYLLRARTQLQEVSNILLK
ncbi:MAG: DUF2333 family protein [Alphaproteobacteria bacterium]|nr:DUF2333 family protein [Alphaproteobacteria bacterium]